jgi:hypothetical protein
VAKTPPKKARKPTPAPPVAPTSTALVPMPVQAEIALKQRQRKQKWTGLPKQGKVRKTVSAILAMKVQGYSTNEIAEHLSLKPASVRQYLWIAGRQGWLSTQDPHEIAHSQLVHRAVSNLDEWLHARDARTGLPDKEVMLESLKGMGIFGGSTPQQQNDGAQTNVLAIQITMPHGNNLPQVQEGSVAGVPAYLEGELVSAAQSRRQFSE